MGYDRIVLKSILVYQDHEQFLALFFFILTTKLEYDNQKPRSLVLIFFFRIIQPQLDEYKQMGINHN